MTDLAITTGREKPSNKNFLNVNVQYPTQMHEQKYPMTDKEKT